MNTKTSRPETDRREERTVHTHQALGLRRGLCHGPRTGQRAY